MARSTTLNVVVAGDMQGLDRTLKQATSRIEKFSKDTDTHGKRVSGQFMAVGAAAKAGLVGLAGGSAAAMAKSFVGAASDINESLSKNRVLFGQYAKSVDQFSRTSASAFGISRKAALEYTGVFGNLFRALGVGRGESAKFSVNLTKLAADMASFNNTSIEDALEAIRSGLVGETEPLRRFGVNLNDATLRQQAMSMGLTHTTKNVLTPYQRSMAAQALIVKQTSAAHGDFARTSGGLANQQRVLQAQLSNTAGQIGAKLLPAALAVVKGFNNLLSNSRQVTSGFRSGWHTAVDAVSGFLRRNRSDVQSVEKATKNVATAIRTVIEHVLIPAFKILLPAIKGVVEGVLTVLRGFVRVVSGALTGDWRKAWQGVKDIVTGSLQGIVSALKGAGKLLLAAAEGAGKGIAKGILAGLGSVGHMILGKLKDALGWVKEHIPKIKLPFGIGDGVGKLPAGGGVSAGGLHGANPALGWVAGAAGRFGLGVSSGRSDHAKYTSSGNLSYHGTGEALDLSNGYETPQEMSFARYMVSKYGSRLAELIYTPLGFSIKDGRRVPPIDAAAHHDHVHVAVDLGRPGVGDGPGRKRFTGDGIGFRGLEDLWVRAGGPVKLAPLMAHVAQAESGGDPRARNRSGASGLWQILGQPFKGNVFDPLTNARMAVWKYQHQGLGAWAASRGAWGRFVGSREMYRPGGGSSGGVGGGSSKPKVTHGTSTVRVHVNPTSVYQDPGEPSDDVMSTQAFIRSRARGGRPATAFAKGYTADQRPPAVDVSDGGDGGDPNQALIDAINANTQAQEEAKAAADALKAANDAVQAELKANRDFATNAQSTSTFQLTKMFADLMSSQMGRGLVGRAFTPGTGVEVAY